MIETMEILKPVVMLLILSCAMLLWLYATRIPAILKLDIELDPTLPSGTQMSQLPYRVRWKADNYNHLLEQPVLFYAAAITLAVVGEGDGLNATLAWIYVGLRVVHSVFQATVNKIPVRFLLFALSSVVLIILVVRLALVVFR